MRVSLRCLESSGTETVLSGPIFVFLGTCALLTAATLLIINRSLIELHGLFPSWRRDEQPLPSVAQQVWAKLIIPI